MRQVQELNPYAAPVSDKASECIPGFRPSLPITETESINAWLTACRIAFWTSVLSLIGMLLLSSRYFLFTFLAARLATWILLMTLAIRSTSWFSAVFVALIYPIPLVSILVYLAVRDQARHILKLHGYHWGWLKFHLSREAKSRIVTGFNLVEAEKNLTRWWADRAISYGIIALLVTFAATLYLAYHRIGYGY